jgi:chromosome segregation ATPase
MTESPDWQHLATLASGALGGGALLKIVQAFLKARNARHANDLNAGVKRTATDSEVGMLLRDELRAEIVRLREEVESLKAQVEKLVELLSARQATETAVGIALAAATAERDSLRAYAKECEQKVGALQADVTRLSFRKQEPSP